MKIKDPKPKRKMPGVEERGGTLQNLEGREDRKLFRHKCLTVATSSKGGIQPAAEIH
jgi:hypothetical protein